MKPLLLMVLAAYMVAAIHTILSFVNKRRALERVALMALAVGFALHTTVLVMDWARDGHYPLYGFRESLSFLAWTLVATYGLVLYNWRASALGSLTLPLVVLIIFCATPMHGNSPMNIGFGATWLLPVHTTLLLFSYAAFFVVFAASLMFLVQERELKLKTFSAFFHRLPSLSTINDIATYAVAIGFTLLTLGITTGMLWSTARDGKIWHNDPKEVFAALTWLLYLALILYRASAGWRGRRAAWLGVLGFALVLCTFLGPRLIGSYHVFE
jgi:ABC-type uncharacterized transport system permease subunit